MTLRKIYIGTTGPYYYDDSEAVDDPDGDFPGQLRQGIVTQQMYVADSPLDPGEVVRLYELEIDTRRYSTMANPSLGFKSSKIDEEKRGFRYQFMLR